MRPRSTRQHQPPGAHARASLPLDELCPTYGSRVLAATRYGVWCDGVAQHVVCVVGVLPYVVVRAACALAP